MRFLLLLIDRGITRGDGMFIMCLLVHNVIIEIQGTSSTSADAPLGRSETLDALNGADGRSRFGDYLIWNCCDGR